MKRLIVREQQDDRTLRVRVSPAVAATRGAGGRSKDEIYRKTGSQQAFADRRKRGISAGSKLARGIRAGFSQVHRCRTSR